jgi:hypothetical protein
MHKENLYLIHDSRSPFPRKMYTLPQVQCHHLTSCTPTKCNLYFYSSLETVIREPALCKLLTFHNPNLIPIFRNLGRLSKESVQVQCCILFFVTHLFLGYCFSINATCILCLLYTLLFYTLHVSAIW